MKSSGCIQILTVYFAVVAIKAADLRTETRLNREQQRLKHLETTSSTAICVVCVGAFWEL